MFKVFKVFKVFNFRIEQLIFSLKPPALIYYKNTYFPNRRVDF